MVGGWVRGGGGGIVGGVLIRGWTGDGWASRRGWVVNRWREGGL